MPNILTFRKMGDPILKQTAEPVDLQNLDLIKPLVEDMIHSLLQENKRLGLAAPQVGVSKRIFIFRLPSKLHARYGGDEIEPIDLHALINPEIFPLDNESVDGLEACISIPGMIGIVPRYNTIRYTYYDLEGKFHERTASGFHARVVQHEVDHLNGILYPERMKDLSTFGFEDVMNESKES